MPQAPESPTGSASHEVRLSGPRALASDVAACLRFASRLPLPRLPWEARRAVPPGTGLFRMLPLAGALLAAIGALVLLVAEVLGLGHPVSAVLATAAVTLTTGALHEDGLADTADGFGGGATPERRLEIMRDSRIGTFGASALVLAFALRIAGLATLAGRLDLAAVMAALVIVGALSRSAALLPMALLPPARAGGLGHGLGTDSRWMHAVAWGVSAVIAVVLVSLTALPWSGIVLAFALAVAAGLGVTALAGQLIRGHTGDVAGAAQQAAEVAALLGLLIAVRP